jgi:hypothetical protein
MSVGSLHNSEVPPGSTKIAVLVKEVSGALAELAFSIHVLWGARAALCVGVLAAAIFCLICLTHGYWKKQDERGQGFCKLFGSFDKQLRSWAVSAVGAGAFGAAGALWGNTGRVLVTFIMAPIASAATENGYAAVLEVWGFFLRGDRQDKNGEQEGLVHGRRRSASSSDHGGSDGPRNVTEDGAAKIAWSRFESFIAKHKLASEFWFEMLPGFAVPMMAIERPLASVLSLVLLGIYVLLGSARWRTAESAEHLTFTARCATILSVCLYHITAVMRTIHTDGFDAGQSANCSESANLSQSVSPQNVA